MVKFLEKLILLLKTNPSRFNGKKVGRQISSIREENTSNELTAKNYWETNPTAAIAKQGYWLSNPIIEKAINHRLSGGKTQGYWLTWLVKNISKIDGSIVFCLLVAVWESRDFDG
jgi:hypothetical protein